MFLVPQESTLNSNMTLDPSVCLGPQVGSKRLVLSGCTEGQVEDRVVTTVMVPSVEQTETRGSTSAGSDLRRNKAPEVNRITHHILGFEEAAFGYGCLDLQTFKIPQK